MTQVDYYIHVEHKLQTLCALAVKALAKSVRVMVLTPNPQATDEVDRFLWTQPAIGFLPHCRASHRLAAVTPLIVDHLTDPIVHEQVLVNLNADCPPLFSRFERVIEIVGRDDEDRAQARERYRFYRDRGYEIRTHDMNASA